MYVILLQWWQNSEEKYLCRLQGITNLRLWKYSNNARLDGVSLRRQKYSSSYTLALFSLFSIMLPDKEGLQATFKLPWVLQRVPFESETLLLLAVCGTEQRERQCFDNLSLPWINNREHNDWNDVQSEGTESCEVSHSLVDLVRGQHTDGGFFNYLPRKWTMLNLTYKMHTQ